MSDEVAFLVVVALMIFWGLFMFYSGMKEEERYWKKRNDIGRRK